LKKITGSGTIEYSDSRCRNAEISYGGTPAMAGTGNYLKDIFLAGVGIFSMTREQIQQVVDKLVSAGQVDSEQAQEIVDQLGDRAENERITLENLIRSQIELLVNEMGLVTAEDMRRINEKLDKIENMLG